MSLSRDERRDLMERTHSFPEQADLLCAICGEHDLRGRFPHQDRTGAMVCGMCWADRERNQHIGAKVRHILARGRVYKTDPVELLRQIRQAVGR